MRPLMKSEPQVKQSVCRMHGYGLNSFRKNNSRTNGQYGLSVITASINVFDVKIKTILCIQGNKEYSRGI